jgi:methanogenic corrinoid protein MtbC1
MASTFQDSLSPRQMAVLEKLIENSIVPRLLLGSRTAFYPLVSDAPSSTPVTVENVGELAELVTKPDAAASIAYFEDLRAGGASVEMLFQDLLVPVARRLGELWDEDINDFMDVTRGASHLQQIVREYSDAFHREARQPVSNRRMLLMTMPGEQHTLGISIVGEHFRRAGWHVWGGPPRTIDDILELVEDQWFDVIGLSLSRVPDPAKVASDIARIRQASINKNVIVQIGGRPFSEDPGLVAAVGADATALDGRQAVLQITAMIHSSNNKTP